MRLPWSKKPPILTINTESELLQVVAAQIEINASQIEINRLLHERVEILEGIVYNNDALYRNVDRRIRH